MVVLTFVEPDQEVKAKSLHSSKQFPSAKGQVLDDISYCLLCLLNAQLASL